MNNKIDMGEYYRSNEDGLIRTVCRAFDILANEWRIGYVKVNDNACVSDVLLLPEDTFYKTFLS
jgi:hypothetical protein